MDPDGQGSTSHFVLQKVAEPCPRLWMASQKGWREHGDVIHTLPDRGNGQDENG